MLKGKLFKILLISLFLSDLQKPKSPAIYVTFQTKLMYKTDSISK